MPLSPYAPGTEPISGANPPASHPQTPDSQNPDAKKHAAAIRATLLGEGGEHSMTVVRARYDVIGDRDQGSRYHVYTSDGRLVGILQVGSSLFLSSLFLSRCLIAVSSGLGVGRGGGVRAVLWRHQTNQTQPVKTQTLTPCCRGLPRAGQQRKPLLRLDGAALAQRTPRPARRRHARCAGSRPTLQNQTRQRENCESKCIVSCESNSRCEISCNFPRSNGPLEIRSTLRSSMHFCFCKI